MYAPNIGAPQYIWQMLPSMKGEITSNTIIVGDFNTPLTPMVGEPNKISKETQPLNDIMDQLDLVDIYRAFHTKAMDFTFFSSAHGTFSRSWKKQESSRKISISALLSMPKPLTVWITINCGKL